MRTLLVLLFLSPFTLLSQIEDANLLKVGTGLSILGDGDGTILSIRNELYHNMNDIFSVSGSLLGGYGIESFLEEYEYLFRSDINLYFSPFGNKRRYNFEVGAGVSYYGSRSKYIMRITRVDGRITEVIYVNTVNQSIGFNVLVDNTIRISGNHHVSFGAFITPYIDGNINSGFVLKYGYRIVSP